MEPEVKPLPESSAGIRNLSLKEISQWYRELSEVQLSSENLGTWLARWSRLDELVTEAASLALIAYTTDTTDPEREQTHLRFSTEIIPQLGEWEVILARKFAAVGSNDPDLQVALRSFREEIAIFREINIPLISETEKLAARYQQITGGMTSPWQGRNLPLPQFNPLLKSHDRQVREPAWRLWNEPYVKAHDQLAELFNLMLSHRQQIARNSGFANYRDYVFSAKYRFDYTPADCERLHEAIEQEVGPALIRLAETRQQHLKVDQLRPWDRAVNIWSDSPAQPYRDGEELQSIAARVFGAVDPVFGSQFQTMINEKLLDLESRPGKAPGGYCDTLNARGLPFIFMNAAGVPDDVNTLLHEGGHSFHAFAAQRHPLLCQRHPGAEAAELASMSMELLAAPYLARPTGYYEKAAAAAVRLEHLEDTLLTLGHIASVDAFQSWIYTHPDGADIAARDRTWLDLRKRFDPGYDWSGLENERIARWYRQLHIFIYPFYYIEYGIAQIGALQVWRNARKDQRAAVQAYRSFLAQGSTRPLPELYAAAGVKLAFDAGTLCELVALVEEEMTILRRELGR